MLLDLFDTLLARRVPRPSDVFLRLGVKLQQAGLLGPGLAPDSFAAIRYQTEYAVRGLRQRQAGDREVTLAEIYQQIPRYVVRVSIDECIAAEIATESELIFANDEVVNLARLAKENGLKLVLISNVYMNETTLRNLLRTKAPDLPELDGFFVSSDHRCGKRNGLMKLMLDTLGIAPQECLHIGDDPVSDRQTAQELGISFIYFGHSEEDFAARLAEEHPIQWHDRVDHFAEPCGDYGVSWLRRIASAWNPSDIAPQDKPFYTYGARMMGPLLSGFALWAGARLKAENGKTLFGITREGDFLTQLASTLDPSVDCKILAANRPDDSIGKFCPQLPASFGRLFNAAWELDN